MAASKRYTVEVEWDVSEIKQSSGASVHFVVADLSPVRESCKNKKIKYFNSKVTDGKKMARAISFDTSLRPAFEESKEKARAMKLINCRIEPVTGRKGKLEMLTNNHSKLIHSPKKFKVSSEDTKVTTKQIQLSLLSDLVVGQMVQ